MSERAYWESDSMSPAPRLVDEREHQIRAVAARGDLDVQLLCSVMLDLTSAVKRLQQQVSELKGRTPV